MFCSNKPRRRVTISLSLDRQSKLLTKGDGMCSNGVRKGWPHWVPSYLIPHFQFQNSSVGTGCSFVGCCWWLARAHKHHHPLIYSLNPLGRVVREGIEPPTQSASNSSSTRLSYRTMFDDCCRLLLLYTIFNRCQVDFSFFSVIVASMTLLYTLGGHCQPI